MAINFPDSPSNGDTFTANGVVYTYNATAALWDTVSAAAAVDFTAIASNILPDADSSRDLGSTTRKWKDLHLSGNTIHLGDTQLKGSGGKLTVADSTGTVINPFNVAPRFTTSPAAELVLGSPDSGRITAVAIDEAGFPITYDWDGYKDSGGSTTVYKDGSLPPQVLSITQPTAGVFRFTNDSAAITPAGTFNFRVKASDGALVSTASTTTVTLQFSSEIIVSALSRDGDTLAASSTGLFSATTNGGFISVSGFLVGDEIKTGKQYLEAKYTQAHTLTNGGLYIGLIDAVRGANNDTGYSTSPGGNVAVWFLQDGVVGHNGPYDVETGFTTASKWASNPCTTGSSITQADVIMFAYDTTAKAAWFGLNNQWSLFTGVPGVGAGMPFTDAGSTMRFFVAYNNVAGTIGVQFQTGGSHSPTYNPPTGFDAY